MTWKSQSESFIIQCSVATQKFTHDIDSRPSMDLVGTMDNFDFNRWMEEKEKMAQSALRIHDRLQCYKTFCLILHFIWF